MEEETKLLERPGRGDPWDKQRNLEPMKLPRSMSSSEPGRTLELVCVTVIAKL